MVVYSLDDSQPMILLANLPVGLRGPQARENIPFVAAFCQLRWQKAATKRSPFGGLGPPNLPIGSKPAISPIEDEGRRTNAIRLPSFVFRQVYRIFYVGLVLLGPAPPSAANSPAI